MFAFQKADTPPQLSQLPSCSQKHLEKKPKAFVYRVGQRSTGAQQEDKWLPHIGLTLPTVEQLQLS